MTGSGILSTYGIIFMGVYLLLLVAIGFWGKMAMKEGSMADYYLAGRNMGLVVLLLTLYATQYSGNTLIGFAGNSYREGYRFLVSVVAMMSVIGGFFIFAPKLFRLSREKEYITPGDYFQDRFNSRTLTIIVSIIFIIALGNYILSNLKAIGYIVEGATGGKIPFTYGVVGLTFIMVLYETLGGMRSVAWTDAIQGVLLLIGCIGIFFAIESEYGGLSHAANVIRETRPDLWSSPTENQMFKWGSTILLFFFGVSIYPHAIQRIYAAKNEKVLKTSLQIMLFMPLFTTFFMFTVGIVGISRFPGLDRAGSEEISLLLLNDLMVKVPGMELLLVLFITAAVAAIMSTADSALLSLSSIFTEDLYRPFKPNMTQKEMVWVGKLFSWGLMIVLTILAITLPQTIWKLIIIKLEILIQVAPAIFLGVHCKNLTTRAIMSGLIAGLGVAILLWATGTKFMGVHAGVWGLLLNLIVIWVVQISGKKSKTLPSS
ncbi:MAG: sodium:solute symporter family protein [Nitrospinae bacterium]|nr:sodium:solute symporter family protein [Nitrospinota bacterium]